MLRSLNESYHRTYVVPSEVAREASRALDLTLGYGIMGASSLIIVLLSRWLIGVKRRTPERIVGFLQRIGIYRYRG